MVDNTKIVIVDDNVIAAEKLKETVMPFFENKEIEIHPSIDQEYFIDNKIDLVFINEGTNSMETLLKIRYAQTYKMDIIIFIENDICIDETELKLPIYLIKKNNKDNVLEAVIKDIQEKWSKNSFVLNLFAGSVKIKDIVYVQSSNNTIVYHLVDGSTVHEWKTLNHCEEKLKKYYFIRCHQSFIVNAKYIKAQLKHCFILSTGMKVSITKKYKEEVDRQYLKYIQRKGK